jgi:hypothetical protein
LLGDSASLAGREAGGPAIEPPESTPEEVARLADFTGPMRLCNVEDVRRQAQERSGG